MLALEQPALSEGGVECMSHVIYFGWSADIAGAVDM